MKNETIPMKNLNKEIIQEFKKKLHLISVDTWANINNSLQRDGVKFKGDGIGTAYGGWLALCKTIEPGVLKLFSQALNKKDEEFVKMCEEILKTKFDDLGMGSLDYHEKCAIDAFKEYIKHRYINKIKGG